MSKEDFRPIRQWKHAFSADPDPESTPPQEVRFTPRQKQWLETAWREYFHGKLPSAIPESTPDGKIVLHQLNEKYEWHHIKSPQDCLAAFENPNTPQNAVPLPARFHTGQSPLPIHPDISQAKAQWVEGIRHPDPFVSVRQTHRQKAIAGQIYWDSAYDDFFLYLAQVVTEKYLHEHPQNTWPEG